MSARQVYLLWSLVPLLVAAGCENNAPAPDRQAPPKMGSVKITSSPSGAAVLVNAHQRVGKTPLVLERQGGSRVDILLIKDGHDSLRRSIYIPEGKQLLQHIELRPKQALMIVSSSGIVGADIFMDGVQVSKTPSRVEVTAGIEHLIEVKKHGFQSYRERVKVEVGEKLEFDADIYPLGRRPVPKGWLRFQSKSKVMVYLDGRQLGSTPLRRIRTRARTHRVKFVSLDKKHSKRMRVAVKAGEVRVVNVDLDLK